MHVGAKHATYQCRGIIGFSKCNYRECPIVKRVQTHLTHRQRHSSGRDKATRDPEHLTGNVGNRERDIRFTQQHEHRSYCKKGPRCLECFRRPVIKTRLNELWMDSSSYNYNEQVGIIREGWIKIISRPRRDARRVKMGRLSYIIKAKGRKHLGSSRYLGSIGQGRRARHPTIHLEKLGCPDYPFMEGYQMMAEAEKNKTKLGEFRENSRSFIRGLGAEEWAFTCMDSLVNRYPNKVLSSKTLGKYKGYLARFLYWWLDEHVGSHGTLEDFTTDNLLKYFKLLAVSLSGENLVAQVRAIVNFIFGEQPKKKEEILQQVAVSRREANLVNPPERKGASPLTFRDIRELLTFSRSECVTVAELQALDILIVAFSTV